jgi:hypothetical protein
MGLLAPINTNIITSIVNYVKNIIASTTSYGLIKIATQSEVNTGTDNTEAVTPLTLKGKFFNSSNIATGSSNVSIDGLNGTANFNRTINSNETVSFTVNNSSIAANSILLYSINYDNSSDSNLSILSYTASTSVATFYVKNTGTGTSSTFSISFVVIS